MSTKVHTHVSINQSTNQPTNPSPLPIKTISVLHNSHLYALIPCSSFSPFSNVAHGYSLICGDCIEYVYTWTGTSISDQFIINCSSWASTRHLHNVCDNYRGWLYTFFLGSTGLVQKFFSKNQQTCCIHDESIQSLLEISSINHQTLPTCPSCPSYWVYGCFEAEVESNWFSLTWCWAYCHPCPLWVTVIPKTIYRGPDRGGVNDDQCKQIFGVENDWIKLKFLFVEVHFLRSFSTNCDFAWVAF